MPPLDQFLIRAYQAQHGMSQETLDAVANDFAAVMAAGDPDGVGAEASTRLAELTDKVCDKCYVSTQQRMFLRRVLDRA